MVFHSITIDKKNFLLKHKTRLKGLGTQKKTNIVSNLFQYRWQETIFSPLKAYLFFYPKLKHI